MAAGSIWAPDFREAPYWWEAAPPSTATVAPPPDRVEVAIVGGGYCGLSAALELGRHGVGVLVVDAARIGHAASSLNGGMVAGSLKASHAELARTFGRERATALLEESARSLPFLEDLLAREAIACDYRRTGRFVGAHCPSAYAALAGRVEAIKRLTGADAWLVPRDRQREEIDTHHYHGGMVAEASGGLHPARYHSGLADAARRSGALVAEETRVDAITRRAGGFTVRTSRGVVEAREVIVATNGYTGAVTPWLRRRLIPLGSYIIATEPLPLGAAGRLIPRGRMIVDTNRVLSYYRLSPDGTRVLYGGRASFRRLTAREAAPRLHAMMVSVWPELAGTRVTHAWMGNVAFTFDHVPHMGVHQGVHYAAGCQGSGVAMATYLGYQTALKIAGKAVTACAFDGLPFPTRPTYTGNPWFLPVVGSYYRLLDWLDRRLAA
ncbi:MAG: FAD-binding oxidoreductase [Candidatus Rokubacteria bacterium]|nr:FAD-binding oxidoreductase [Candidatus Rokubacteria bacterium]